VRAQIDAFQRRQGYSRTHELFISSLRVRQNEFVTFDLTAGVSYLFYGACDRDCSDLDFRLYDPYGNLIDEDLASDDYPMVSVTPHRSGTYQLRADMYSCSTTLCFWGVGAFRN
jgi:hypothetical protein